MPKLITLKMLAILAWSPLAFASTYYVSPVGSDANPGTSAAPWASFYHAAQTLQAGDVAIFADGTYLETQRGIVANSGVNGASIVFKAQNKRGAKLVFSGLQSAWGKIYVTKSYVTIQDFEITQDVKGSDGADVLVHFGTINLADPPTVGNEFIGNNVHGAYFMALKAYKQDNFTADGNDLHDVGSGAFVATNQFGTVFRNNEIYDAGTGDGITLKGGVRSAQVYNNVVQGLNLYTGMFLGGSTDANATYDTSGYEAYNSVAYNNVIIGGTYGIFLLGCRDCAVFNNVVTGAQSGIATGTASDVDKGWTWNPPTVNPRIQNNAIGNAQSAFATPVGNDFNLYWNNASSPSETHGVYSDPMFVDVASDWHLQAGSPAIGRGNSNTFTGFLGESIDVSKDFSGVQRTVPFDIGVYVYTSATDTTAPTAPATLTGTAFSASQINLSWSASTDNVGVTGYAVERCQGNSCVNFVQVAPSVPVTAWQSTGLAANTWYRFRVRAFDAAGNMSVYSPIATVKTKAH